MEYGRWRVIGCVRDGKTLSQVLSLIFTSVIVVLERSVRSNIIVEDVERRNVALWVMMLIAMECRSNL